MRRTHKILIVLTTLLGMATVACAQSGSLNTFSPYSFYGIGDPIAQGSVALRAMGGAGVGYRSALRSNTMNPASYSAMAPNSAIFSLGFDVRNFYLADPTTSSSFNTANIRDIVFQIPLWRRLGLAVSATPYSEIGYRVSREDDIFDAIADIGRIKYIYEGSGGVMQFKAGIGWGITERLSIGGDLVYYHGDITRNFAAAITSITGNGSYGSLSGYSDEIVNTFLGNFGVQYTPLMTGRTVLTVGATYTMGGRMRGEITKYIPSNNMSADTIRYYSAVSSMNLPQKFALGAYMHTTKISVGADWEYATWGDANASNTVGAVGFRNTNAIRLGMQWTPNPGDVRNVMNRWTYRLGVRWSNYYMTVNGARIDDQAITFGVSIPLGAARVNNIDVGFEVGQRGRMQAGILRERYFGISLGLSLFGEDYWFVKRKYD